jgi:drug/metabolite transporter (DMT)-like permease
MNRNMTAHAPHYHLKVGIGYILLTWLCFSLTSPLVRDVNKTVPMALILCTQGIVGLLSTLPWMFKHGRDSLKSENWGLILFRSICGLLNYLCLFLAMVHTTLVDTFLLANAAPLLLPFVCWIWLKKPIQHKLWPGLIGGFIGLILILKPGSEILNAGAFYALGNALITAIVMVTLRLLSYTTRSHTVLFYYFLITILMTLPLALYLGHIPNGIEWLELLGIALLSTLAQLFMIRSFHHASPTALGPFNYSAVVYAGALDWLLYGSKPDLFSLLGILLVICGGIWSIKQTQNTERKPQN